MILFLEAVMMGLVLWQTLEHSMESSRTQLAATEQTILNLVGNVSRNALLTEKYADLQPYLENLQEDPRVIKAILADAQQRVVASTRSDDIGKALDSALATHNNTDDLWRRLEINNAAGKLGELAIGFSNQALHSAYTKARNRGLVIAAFGMAIIAIAGILTGFLLTRRLERITTAAQHVAAGEASVATGIQGNDELGELARSFDSMAQSVAEKQRQLQESIQYNRTLFEQSAIGLALCKMNGELVDINQAYADIIGRSIEETLRLSYWDITPKSYIESEERQLNNLDATGRYGPYEKEYIHKDGHLVPVRLQGQLLERNGETFIWSSVEDISRSKQTEEALRRAQKMEAIGQLSGGVAHDFNNQLGVIIGYLDFLQEYTEKDEVPQKWVATASRATMRCRDLTRQLLAFSRQQNKERTVVNLNTSVKEQENMIKRSVTPEVEVQYFLANKLWLTEIDECEFHDSLLNLVINARDAMPNGGKLLIETSNKYLDEDYAELHYDTAPGDYVQLMISDTGTGMNKETLEHVFEPFFTTKSKDKGTGLGLAMVYGFVKRYDGHIKIYSEPDVGTTIRIYLPRSTLAEPGIVARDNIKTELPTGSEKILIVDDEADLLQLAKKYLSDLGYQTRTAKNAPQALAILADDDSIDVLFSDVVMPGGMNGYELAKQATQQKPELRVLLTSGFTSKTIAYNGLARFSSHLLSKPYRKAELAQHIRLVLDENSNA